MYYTNYVQKDVLFGIVIVLVGIKANSEPEAYRRLEKLGHQVPSFHDLHDESNIADLRAHLRKQDCPIIELRICQMCG